MKIGIVGGTFDPIHIAHMYLVTECKAALGLDHMVIIPNGDPPHKESGVTAAHFRHAMVTLAAAEYPGVEVSDMEVRGNDPSYTFKTLERLKTGRFKADDLYFIIGADSLINFKTWKEPERILPLCTLVCFDRPGYKPSEVEAAAFWVFEHGGRLIRIDSLELEISSTDIRRRFLEGESAQAFLHPAVYRFINDNQLYMGD